MRLVKMFVFLLFYAKEVVLANFQIAWQILSPRGGGRRPEFVTISVEGLNDRQLLIVTNLITITPGTLSGDVSADGRTVLIHQLIRGNSKAEDRAKMENDYVRRVREIF